MGPQHQLCQCRYLPRHRDVCRRFDSGLVEGGRPQVVCAQPNPHPHRRWGRPQCLSHATLESGLQKLADYTGRNVVVRHFPPGTSKCGTKWSIDCSPYISSTGRGEPLRDYETIVSLIARTTTSKGHSVTCRLDRTRYAIAKRFPVKNSKLLTSFLAIFPPNGTTRSDARYSTWSRIDLSETGVDGWGGSLDSLFQKFIFESNRRKNSS